MSHKPQILRRYKPPHYSFKSLHPIYCPLLFTHSGLDCFQQQDGLFVLAGSLSEFSPFDKSVALHVEKWHHLQLLIFFHHPGLSVVRHGVSHPEAAGNEKQNCQKERKTPTMKINRYKELSLETNTILNTRASFNKNVVFLIYSHTLITLIINNTQSACIEFSEILRN